MIESFIANSQRKWEINLDSFNPLDARKNKGLISRLNYILQVVFYVKLHVSTINGSENFCIFLAEMPDKFEKEKIDVNFE
jgi:hypothetical protein